MTAEAILTRLRGRLSLAVLGDILPPFRADTPEMAVRILESVQQALLGAIEPEIATHLEQMAIALTNAYLEGKRDGLKANLDALEQKEAALLNAVTRCKT